MISDLFGKKVFMTAIRKCNEYFNSKKREKRNKIKEIEIVLILSGLVVCMCLYQFTGCRRECNFGWNEKRKAYHFFQCQQIGGYKTGVSNEIPVQTLHRKIRHGILNLIFPAVCNAGNFCRYIPPLLTGKKGPHRAESVRLF